MIATPDPTDIRSPDALAHLYLGEIDGHSPVRAAVITAKSSSHWRLRALLIIAPFVISNQYVAALILAAIYTVITAGVNLFMGYTGQISFGHNAFAAIGGYGSAIFPCGWAGPPVITMVVAAAGSSSRSGHRWIPDAEVARPLSRDGHTGARAYRDEIATQWKSMTQGLFGISAIPSLGFMGWQLTSDFSFYVVYWLIAGLAILVTHRIYNSRVGLAFRAMAGNEDAAQSIGIDVARYKLIAFVISAVFASIGGSMFAHYVTYISPEVFGLYMVILLFTMLFVGGISTTLGPLIGAVIITIFPSCCANFTRPESFFTV